jgi:transposase InsO family protein
MAVSWSSGSDNLRNDYGKIYIIVPKIVKVLILAHYRLDLPRGVVVAHPNQVWRTYLTYIRLTHGF